MPARRAGWARSWYARRSARAVPYRDAIVHRSARAVGRGGGYRSGSAARRVGDGPGRARPRRGRRGAAPDADRLLALSAVVLYVTLLAILAAVIAGVLPAVKATGALVQR